MILVRVLACLISRKLRELFSTTVCVRSPQNNSSVFVTTHKWNATQHSSNPIQNSHHDNHLLTFHNDTDTRLQTLCYTKYVIYIFDAFNIDLHLMHTKAESNADQRHVVPKEFRDLFVHSGAKNSPHNTHCRHFCIFESHLRI